MQGLKESKFKWRWHEYFDARTEVDLRIGRVFNKLLKSVDKRLSFGTVKTPILALIVDQYNLIKDKESFRKYHINAKVKVGEVEIDLISKQSFKNQEQVEQKIEKDQLIEKEGQRYNISIKNKDLRRKYFYALNTRDLEIEASQYCKMELNEVQQYSQILYENGVITNPNTTASFFHSTFDEEETLYQFHLNDYWKESVETLRKHKRYYIPRGNQFVPIVPLQALNEEEFSKKFQNYPAKQKMFKLYNSMKWIYLQEILLARM